MARPFLNSLNPCTDFILESWDPERFIPAIALTFAEVNYFTRDQFRELCQRWPVDRHMLIWARTRIAIVRYAERIVAAAKDNGASPALFRSQSLSLPDAAATGASVNEIKIDDGAHKTSARMAALEQSHERLASLLQETSARQDAAARALDAKLTAIAEALGARATPQWRLDAKLAAVDEPVDESKLSMAAAAVSEPVDKSKQPMAATAVDEPVDESTLSM